MTRLDPSRLRLGGAASRTWKTAAGIVVLVGTLVAPIAGPSPVGAADSDDSTVVFVGEWSVLDGQPSALVADNRRRHVISLRSVTDLQVGIHDESGDLLHSGSIPSAVIGQGVRNSPVAYYFDEASGYLYLATYATPAMRITGAALQVMVLDLSDPSRVDEGQAVVVAHKPVRAFPPSWHIVGMTRDPESGRLWLLGQQYPTLVPTERYYGVMVAEIDPATEAAEFTATGGPIPVPGCAGAVRTRHTVAVAKVADSVFFGCSQPSILQAQVPGPPTPPAVMAVDITDPARSRAYFLPGPYNDGESFLDPAGGEAGRLILVASALNRPGNAVWVFDLAHRTIVGQFSAGHIRGAGVDPLHGRVYAAFRSSVLIGSGRGFPLPLPPPAMEGLRVNTGRVFTIPYARRVILPVEIDGEDVLGIFRDDILDDAFTEAPLPDWNQEDAKRTDAGFPQFGGNAQAFGSRVKQLGGVGNLVATLTGTSPDFWQQEGLGSATGLEDGTRDIQFAKVQDAALSQNEASAGAVAVSADGHTENDVSVITGEDSWPFGEARCAVFGVGAERSARASPDWAAGSQAEAECDGDSEVTTASARWGGFGVPKVVSVGSSLASTTLERTESGGARVVTQAEARDVSLGEAVHIERVASKSVADARGGAEGGDGTTKTPGEATATYERIFEGVSTPDFSCADECNPNEVLEQITAALGMHFRVEMPKAERLATPGGAHAHVWRDPWEQEQAIATTEQDPTEIQIPALRIQFVGDSTLPWRGIVELAATEADASSIMTVPSPTFEFPSPPPAPDPAEPSVPVVAEPNVPAPGADPVPKQAPGEPPVPPAGPAAPALSAGTSSQPQVVEVKGAAATARTTHPVEAVTESDSSTRSFVERVKQGWDWFFRSSLAALALTGAVWLVFAVGPYLIVRRRLLLRLMSSGP